MDLKFDTILRMRFRFWLIILVIFSVNRVDALPVSHLNFPSCGQYEVTGRFECKSSDQCLIRIFPYSQSEMIIKLTTTPKRAQHLVDSFIRTQIKVTHVNSQWVQAVPLDAVPLRARKDLSSKAVRLIKKSGCS